MESELLEVQKTKVLYRRNSRKKGSYRPRSRRRLAKRNLTVLKNNISIHHIAKKISKGNHNQFIVLKTYLTLTIHLFNLIVKNGFL